MKSFLYYSLICFTYDACTNANREEKHTGETIAQIDEPANSCYVGTSGKDSAILNINADGNKIGGTLSYKFYEKDSNQGSVNGTKNGDTLIADYTFTSEGQTSVRQVAFLQKENSLIEGYGDMEEKDGKMQFKSPAKLNFGNGFKLEKVPCK
jgi:hypothetical protein